MIKPLRYAARARLRKGWTQGLLKVANLDGGWGFQRRAADPDGALRSSATPNKAIGDAQVYFRDRAADLEGACYEKEFAYWPPASRRVRE